MPTLHDVRQLAHYNTWMNDKLYATAGQLSHEALAQDRQAFFRSILGTLNHLMVGDIVWLKRFLKHPAAFPALAGLAEIQTPERLDQTLSADLAGLRARREWLDRMIAAWANELTEQDLQHDFSFTTMNGVARTMRFSDVLMHFFNHQTHHRGQVTTLLSQAGVDVGVTDLLAVLPRSA